MATIINADTSDGLKLTSDTSGQLELQSAGSTKVTMDTTGNVGIGTASPATKLHLQRNGTAVSTGLDGSTVLTLQSTGTSGSSTHLNILSGSTGSTGQSVITFGDTDAPYKSGIKHRNADNSLAFETNDVERMRIDSSGNLKFNSGYGSVATAYGCRAWVKFNGVGTVSITASGGVTSITDNGTGDYTVNFSITFPDAHYALGASTDADTVNGAVCYMNGTSAPTTTTCRLATKLLNNSSVDRDRVMTTFTR